VHSLNYLSASEFISAARSLPHDAAAVKRSKAEAIEVLVSFFLRLCNDLSIMDEEVVLQHCSSDLVSPPPTISRLTVISSYFEQVFDVSVAAAFRRPMCHLLHTRTLDLYLPHIHHEHCESLTWISLPATDLVHKLERLSKADILSCLRAIPSSVRPTYNFRYQRQCSSSLVQHMQSHVSYLFSLSDYEFLHAFLSVLPFTSVVHRPSSVLNLLYHEYSHTIIDTLREPPQTLSNKLKESRQVAKEQAALEECQMQLDIEEAWPTVVNSTVVLDCLRDYQTASGWHPRAVCAVCSQHVDTIKEVMIRNDNNDDHLPINLHLLHLTNRFIMQKCIVQRLSSDFTNYDCPALNGVMLDKEGVGCPTSTTTTVKVCTDCYCSLMHVKVPRFVLANNLYRGSLPDRFRDLTWVEEMVCSLYRNLAHVTHLYWSSDPAQPFVFHGNICAHETNLLSTVKVLPHTPADINGMLTIVFVGATKLDAKSLRSLFRVRMSQPKNE
jgi:hypothetical protein